jgi:hypothetical protein
MASGASTEGLGRLVENAVANLCARSFFPDFVVRNPKYRKIGGQEKEAADVMTVFGSTMIALQVKTRILPEGTASELSTVENDRFTRMIAKALSQFRSLIEAWRTPGFGQFLNGRGLPLELERNHPKRLYLIVVYAALKPDGTNPDFNLRCSKSCHSETAIPIHLFTYDEFEGLLGMLDTLPDFVHYLETRAALHELSVIGDLTSPFDVWTLATFERPRMVAAMENKTHLDIDGLMHLHHESVAKLEQDEKASYVVDWIINELYSGSGRLLTVDPRVAALPGLVDAPGSVQAYQRCIPYLAQLNRDERGKLVRELLVRVDRSLDGSPSFGGLKFANHKEGYLVFATPEARTLRHPTMINLGLAFAYKMKLSRVVCIGTGSRGPRVDGCDALTVEIDPSLPSTALEKAALELFGASRSE